jgi:hypothetical protein
VIADVVQPPIIIPQLAVTASRTPDRAGRPGGKDLGLVRRMRGVWCDWWAGANYPSIKERRPAILMILNKEKQGVAFQPARTGYNCCARSPARQPFSAQGKDK